MVGLVFVGQDFAALCLSPRFTEDFEAEVVILLPLCGSRWHSDGYHKREKRENRETEEESQGGKEERRNGVKEKGKKKEMEDPLPPFSLPPFLVYSFLPSSFFHFSSKSKFHNLSRNT
jgi:hypothetical protein